MNTMPSENAAIHSFASRVNGLLEERNISRAEFAEAMGMAYSTLGGYLTESHSPDLDTLVRIGDYLDVSIDYLLGRTDCRFMDSTTFSKPETEMLRLYKQLSENRQYEAMGEVKGLLKVEKEGK